MYSDGDSIMSEASRNLLGVKVSCNEGAMKQAQFEISFKYGSTPEQIDPSKTRDDSTERWRDLSRWRVLMYNDGDSTMNVTSEIFSGESCHSHTRRQAAITI